MKKSYKTISAEQHSNESFVRAYTNTYRSGGRKLKNSYLEKLLHGSVETSVLEDGYLVPERLFLRQREAFDSMGRGHRASTSTGCYLDFLTAATRLSFDCRVLRPLDAGHVLYQQAMDRFEGSSDGLAEKGVVDGIDIEIVGKGTQTVAARKGHHLVELDNPEGAEREIRIYYPSIMRVSIGDLSSDKPIRPVPRRPHLLVLGDSIAQGFVVGSPSRTWPSILAASLGLDLVNQSVAGTMFDQHFLEGLELLQPNPPAAVVVAYGTNDWSRKASGESVRKDAEDFIERLRVMLPHVPVYVLSPIWRADEDESMPCGVSFGWMGGMLEGLCETSECLHFVDGRDAMPHYAALMSDGRLHPNAHGARFIAEAVKERMVKDGLASARGSDKEFGADSDAWCQVRDTHGPDAWYQARDMQDLQSLQDALYLPHETCEKPDAWCQVSQTPQTSAVPHGCLDEIPDSLPALIQCERLTKQVTRAGFDWGYSEVMWAKLVVEAKRLQSQDCGSEASVDSFGRLLFSLVTWGRLWGIDAEYALMRANRRFRDRWEKIEQYASKGRMEVDELYPEELISMMRALEYEQFEGAVT